MNREERRKAQRKIDKVSRDYGDAFVEVPSADWPKVIQGLRRVLRNRTLLVQEYEPAPGTEDMVVCRLSVNLIDLDGDRWADGIEWNTLQRIKNEAGYDMFDAVEVYPRKIDLVDVAAMRHLFVLRGLLPFAWRR